MSKLNVIRELTVIDANSESIRTLCSFLYDKQLPFRSDTANVLYEHATKKAELVSKMKFEQKSLVELG
jgi:hypothetical protein